MLTGRFGELAWQSRKIKSFTGLPRLANNAVIGIATRYALAMTAKRAATAMMASRR